MPPDKKATVNQHPFGGKVTDLCYGLYFPGQPVRSRSQPDGRRPWPGPRNFQSTGPRSRAAQAATSSPSAACPAAISPNIQTRLSVLFIFPVAWLARALVLCAPRSSPARICSAAMVQRVCARSWLSSISSADWTAFLKISGDLTRASDNFPIPAVARATRLTA